MRPVVMTATLLTTLWLGLPSQVTAQDPPSPPTPAQEPPPPPPRQEVAVPRAERIRAQETDVRATDSSDARMPARAIERAAGRDEQSVGNGGVRREPVSSEAGSRRRTQADASGTLSAVDEEQRGAAERRGAARRPPVGGSSREGAQAPRDRAVPRSSAPRPTPRVYVYPDYYRYYNRYYDPWGYGAFGLGYFYYSPWGWNPGYYGPGYAYGYGGRYGYGYDVGSVKLKVKPRDAEVYVDGYFAGHVDDFDGIFQALKLDSGGYRIEIRKPGFETLRFDVRVQPERSITFRGELRPAP